MLVQEKRRGSGWKAAEWVLGVVGGVAVFFGMFTAFGPENEYIGLGGDLSWRVGDISNAWIFGMFIGGIVLLAGLFLMIVAGRERLPMEGSAFIDLAWHAGVFTAVNALVWIQDFALGDGLDYAHFMTIPWAIGLAIHAAVVRFESTAPVIEQPVERKELQHH